MYWEYRKQTAIRKDNWKAYRKDKDKQWELYNIDMDIEENNNISDDHPDIIEELAELAKQASIPAKSGTIFDKSLIEKDSKQAPHERKN